MMTAGGVTSRLGAFGVLSQVGNGSVTAISNGSYNMNVNGQSAALHLNNTNGVWSNQR